MLTPDGKLGEPRKPILRSPIESTRPLEHPAPDAPRNPAEDSQDLWPVSVLEAPAAIDPALDSDEPPPRVIKVKPQEYPLLAEIPARYLDVVTVRLRHAAAPKNFDTRGERYAASEHVLVDTERGPRIAEVLAGTHRVPVLGSLRRVVRRARADELVERERSQQAEQEAHRLCRDLIRSKHLPMKLLSSELVPHQRATFFVATEERIELRDLSRDLTQQLHARIEFRQIGARDGAKLIGGIGSCGRELCCTTFLPAFQPVSIRMAKDQGMVLNPSKLAGQCGRLKCCLVYEHSLYKDLGKGLPKVGKRVQTPDGIGRVLDLDILRQRVRVQLPEGGTKSYAGAEVQPITAPSGTSPEPAEDAADSHEALAPAAPAVKLVEPLRAPIAGE